MTFDVMSVDGAKILARLEIPETHARRDEVQSTVWAMVQAGLETDPSRDDDGSFSQVILRVRRVAVASR
jgi:hypothetical protein